MIVSLLSDYGYQDNNVGIVKAKLLSQVSGVHIVDISHDVTQHHQLQCAYLLDASLTHFPPSTLHLCLFGTMYRQPAKVLITKFKDQFIISADNGVLSLFLDAQEAQAVYALPQIPATNKEWEQMAIELIKHLQTDTSNWHEHLVLHQIEEYVVPPKPILKNTSIECCVVHVDRFGNVVLNIKEHDFEHYRAGRKFKIVLPRKMYIDKISVNYSDVPNEEKLCRFNEAGYLEIAINKANAATLIGLSLYNANLLIYTTIKIDFE